VDYIHLVMDTLAMAVHLQSDVTEIKSNLVRMDAKIDTVKDSLSALGQKVAAIEPKLNSMEALFDSKLGTVEAKLDAKLSAVQATMTRWMIGIILAIAAAAFGKPLLELAAGAQALNGRNDVGVQPK
jgi:hypothetical protein